MIRNPDEIRRVILQCQRDRVNSHEREARLRRDLAEAEGRMTIVRYLYENKGRTYQEIGDRIGTSRQFVYQLLHPEVRRRREGRA